MAVAIPPDVQERLVAFIYGVGGVTEARFWLLILLTAHIQHPGRAITVWWPSPEQVAQAIHTYPHPPPTQPPRPMTPGPYLLPPPPPPPC